VEQEQRKISNPSLPSLPSTELFQLTVAGSHKKVKRFWEFIKNTTAYRLSTDLHMVFDNLDHKGSMHIVMQLEETLSRQTRRNREESKVQMRDHNGKNILFTLLGAQIVEMSDGMIYIHGQNFDIFADPCQDSRDDREGLEATRIDTDL
jgi:hypothetical protein